MPIDNDGTFDTDGESLFFKHLVKDLPKEHPEKEELDADEKLRREHRESPKAEEDPDEPETTDEDAEKPSEQEEEGDDEEKQEKRYVEDDDAIVKIKVGEDEQEHSLKSLKRLAGQEAALTQKSQQLAVKRKQVEDAEATHMAASNALLEMARKRYEPYAKIDFLQLSRDPQVTNEQLSALRAEAEAANAEVKFLENQTGKFWEAIQQNQHLQRVETAKETIKQLGDAESPYHIDGFDQTVYDGLREFAMANGIPASIANNIIDAPALKLIHCAKLYLDGKSKVTTTRVNKSVKRVVKTSKTMSSTQRVGKPGSDKAMAQLKKSGTVDAATNVFLTRFKEIGGVE